MMKKIFSTYGVLSNPTPRDTKNACLNIETPFPPNVNYPPEFPLFPIATEYLRFLGQKFFHMREPLRDLERTIFRNGEKKTWIPDDGCIIITGANRGIGEGAALYLAKVTNCLIIMACRDVNQGEETAERIRKEAGRDNIRVLPLDLSKFDSIKEFVRRFKDLSRPLHLLVNNAGLMKEERIISEEGMEYVLQVNHVGVQCLTNMLLDSLMAAEPPARIVTVASIAHLFGILNFDDMNMDTISPVLAGSFSYGRSKLCNILFARQLQLKLNELGRSDILCVLVHPGSVYTGLYRDMPGFVKSFMKLIFKDIHWGARPTVYGSIAPASNLVPGGFYADCLLMQTNELTRNLDGAKRLWDYTEEKIIEHLGDDYKNANPFLRK